MFAGWALAALLTGCVIPYTVNVPAVRGRAMDAKSRDPAPDVSVALAAYPETVTTTQPDGSFETPGVAHWRVFSLPLGDRIEVYELQLTSPSIKPVSMQVRTFRETAIDVGAISVERQKDDPANTATNSHIVTPWGPHSKSPVRDGYGNTTR